MTTASLSPIDLTGPEFKVLGADPELGQAGVSFHRLPVWARQRHHDPLLNVVESMPAGARIELLTDATQIELTVQLTMVQIGAEPGPAASFDLTVDGALLMGESTRTGAHLVIDPQTRSVTLNPGGPTAVAFKDLPAGDKHLEIWLPHAAVVTLVGIRTNGRVAAPPPTVRRRWIHYGSSISHCFEAARPTGTWPTVAARMAGVDLDNLGFAGQCQLDPFVAHVIAARPVQLVSLKLGINVINGDTMRERVFVPAVHGLLDTVRAAHPEVPLLLITPIICPAAEDHPGPTLRDELGQTRVTSRTPELSNGALTLRRIRVLEADIVDSRRKAGDVNLHLLNGLDLFNESDLADLSDGLHPNAVGYERMGRRFYESVFVNGPFTPANMG